MRISLKPLDQQVIFVTGASSGIGRVTARRAAERGAKVMLVARNEQALQGAVRDITQAGGEAHYAVADVADKDELQRAADAAVDRFGRIDTWVNDAGVGMYGRIDQTDLADARRLFDTNFWGMVNGSRLALQYLRQNGGALINVGSEVSDRAIPLQAFYSASKHALLGFTDALRSEVEEANLPISVTTIKPAGINTPYTRHARNYTAQEPTLPAPVYAPAVVADQILFAASHPRRELYAGGASRMMSALGRVLPGVMDKVLGASMYSSQLTKRPADHSNEGLYRTAGGHDEEGDAGRDHHIVRHSVYGAATRQPVAATATFALVVAAVAALMMSRSTGRRLYPRSGRALGRRLLT